MERVSDPHPTTEELLDRIAASRVVDPLAPVTVICPSHLSALQLRRRLAERTAFAAVRFETLPRLAELVGASALAAQGRRPLARPIGDHLAERVAERSGPPLDRIHRLPGYARALRRLFARLRRGGLVGGEEPPPDLASPHLREVMRLYGLWRGLIRDFYDEDDLLGAAAAVARDAPARVAELGALHLVPPGPRSADGDAFLSALGAARGGVLAAADPSPTDDVRMILAPDRASEAREAAREVIAALEEGLGLHEIAVLHGADRAYARPLREALEAAAVPVAAMPGLPLVETPAGRGVLELLGVVREDLSRTALMDTLSVAPVRRELPAAGGGLARLRLGRWDRVSRAAGVTHGIERWRTRPAGAVRRPARADGGRAPRRAGPRLARRRDRRSAGAAGRGRDAVGAPARAGARRAGRGLPRAAAGRRGRLPRPGGDRHGGGAGRDGAPRHRGRGRGHLLAGAVLHRAARQPGGGVAARGPRRARACWSPTTALAAGLRFAPRRALRRRRGAPARRAGHRTPLVPDAAWAALRRGHPHVEDAASAHGARPRRGGAGRGRRAGAA